MPSTSGQRYMPTRNWSGAGRQNQSRTRIHQSVRMPPEQHIKDRRILIIGGRVASRLHNDGKAILDQSVGCGLRIQKRRPQTAGHVRVPELGQGAGYHCALCQSTEEHHGCPAALPGPQSKGDQQANPFRPVPQPSPRPQRHLDSPDRCLWNRGKSPALPAMSQTVPAYHK